MYAHFLNTCAPPARGRVDLSPAWSYVTTTSCLHFENPRLRFLSKLRSWPIHYFSHLYYHSLEGDLPSVNKEVTTSYTNRETLNTNVIHSPRSSLFTTAIFSILTKSKLGYFRQILSNEYIWFVFVSQKNKRLVNRNVGVMITAITVCKCV